MRQCATVSLEQLTRTHPNASQNASRTRGVMEPRPHRDIGASVKGDAKLDGARVEVEARLNGEVVEPVVILPIRCPRAHAKRPAHLRRPIWYGSHQHRLSIEDDPQTRYVNPHRNADRPTVEGAKRIAHERLVEHGPVVEGLDDAMTCVEVLASKVTVGAKADDQPVRGAHLTKWRYATKIPIDEGVSVCAGPAPHHLVPPRLKRTDGHSCRPPWVVQLQQHRAQLVEEVLRQLQNAAVHMCVPEQRQIVARTETRRTKGSRVKALGARLPGSKPATQLSSTQGETTLAGGIVSKSKLAEPTASAWSAEGAMQTSRSAERSIAATTAPATMASPTRSTPKVQ
eukprot:1335509-Prymnesium_polylepis.3